MAQNITLLGASYPDCPAVLLPKTGGGTARFDDASITTATASDVASGKLFLAADGTITTGTSSGGGGSSWELLASREFLVSNYTSTGNSSVDAIRLDSSIWDGDVIIWVRVRDTEGKRAGYFYGSDSMFFNYMARNGATGTLSSSSKAIHRYTSSSQLATYYGSSGYGVYGYSISDSGLLYIYKRYSGTNSLTINSTYAVEVYKLSLASGEKVYD